MPNYTPITLKYCEYNRHAGLLFLITEIDVLRAHDISTIALMDGDFAVNNVWITHKPLFESRCQINLALTCSDLACLDGLCLQVTSAGQHSFELAPLKSEIKPATVGLVSAHEGKDGTTYIAWRTKDNMPDQSGIAETPGENDVMLDDDVRVGPISDAQHKALCAAASKASGHLLLNPVAKTKDCPGQNGLKQFKHIHKGETMWLIGNGPSVQLQDLQRLKDRLCFAFNRFHLCYDDTSFRPTYTLVGDQQVVEDFGPSIAKHAGGTLFMAHHQSFALATDTIHRYDMIPGYPPLFSDDIEQGLSSGGSSVFQAMQIAHYMGVKTLVLVGIDFDFTFQATRSADDPYRTATGDSNHFIKNYRSDKAWCPPALRDIVTAFWAAKTFFAFKEVKVLNATRGGRLDIFDRIDFETALSL